MPDTMCAQNFVCQGNKRGDCVAATTVNCSHLSVGCNQGQCNPDNGMCVSVALQNGDPCSDNNACTSNDTCNNGTCSSSTSTACADDNNDCTNDSCDPQSGCTYTFVQANTCSDDDACTTGDACSPSTQNCAGTPKTCAGSADGCRTGTCDSATGVCGTAPKADGTACADDGKVCTAAATQVCTGGTCGSTSATSACGPGASGCTETGVNRTCTCMAGYDADANMDLCIPDLCDPNPCGANTDCTAAPGATQPTCTCKAGWVGTPPGVACTDKNECEPNPCGKNASNVSLGDCMQGPAGSGTYTCDCVDGYTQVNGTCVCDLDGTFAMRVQTKVEWMAGFGYPAGEYLATAWFIRKHEYDATGNLAVTSIQCGGTSPTLCNSFLPEAYSTFSPNSMYGSDNDSKARPDIAAPFAIPNALPGQPVDQPPYATISGIHLPNPLTTPWPTTYTAIANSGGANSIYWVDDDHDGKLGVTAFVTPPGGQGIELYQVGGMSYVPVPQQTFTDPVPASVCPLPLAGDRHYAWAPVFESDTGATAAERADCIPANGICRLKANFAASRVINELDGTFMSCDEMRGTLPIATIKQEARVGGCIVDGENGSHQDCSYTDSNEKYPPLIKYSDEQANVATGQEITETSFVIRRATDAQLLNDLTCAEVRAMTF